jgi:hypothetical protein
VIYSENREERKGFREQRRARIPAVKSKQCSAEESVEFGRYQGCRGFRIELRVGVEESSGKRLSGSRDSAVESQL